MYIRFVVSEWDEWAGAEAGLFGAAYDVKWERAAAPDWIRDEVLDALYWFEDHLPIPGRLHRRRGRVRGVCWFRPEAAEAISRARYLAWLLTEAGHPVLELRRRQPGAIIWRDAMQVVAKPPRDLRRMFA